MRRLLLLASVLPLLAAAPAADVRPEPVIVVTAPDPAGASGLAISPAVSAVALAPDTGDVWRVEVTNHGDIPLELDLAVSASPVGTAPVVGPGPGPGSGGPAGSGRAEPPALPDNLQVVLPEDRVILRPDERASLGIAVRAAPAAAAGGQAVELTASTAGLEPVVQVVAVLLVGIGDATPSLSLDTALSGEGTEAVAVATITNDGDAYAVTRGSLRVTSAIGGTRLEHTFARVVVAPGVSRTVSARFRPGLVPASHRLEVIAAADGEDAVMAATSAMLGQFLLLVAAGVLVALVTVVLVVLIQRRRRLEVGRQPAARSTSRD